MVRLQAEDCMFRIICDCYVFCEKEILTGIIFQPTSLERKSGMGPGYYVPCQPEVLLLGGGSVGCKFDVLKEKSGEQ